METYLPPRDDEFALVSTVLDGFFYQDFMEPYHQETTNSPWCQLFFEWLLLSGFHGTLPSRDDEFALVSTVLDGFFYQDFMETYLPPRDNEFALVSTIF
jgi:hypothetical protein